MPKLETATRKLLPHPIARMLKGQMPVPESPWFCMNQASAQEQPRHSKHYCLITLTMTPTTTIYCFGSGILMRGQRLMPRHEIATRKYSPHHAPGTPTKFQRKMVCCGYRLLASHRYPINQKVPVRTLRNEERTQAPFIASRSH